MLTVEWRDEARADLRQIIAYIAEDNPEAATRLRTAIEYAVDRLPDFPYLYRVGRAAGTRELVVHPNYMIVYRVQTSTIEVVAVVHARRRYPE